MNKKKIDLAIEHTNDLFIEIYALGYEDSRKNLFREVNKLLSPEHKKAIREAMKKVEIEKKSKTKEREKED
jgi:hypothetical protein